MKEIIKIIANQLLKGIKNKYGDNCEKVTEVKTFWFYQKYLLFSVANSKRLFGKNNTTLVLLAKMAELKLIPGHMIDFYQSNTNIVDNLVESSYQLFDCDDNELADCYENLLNIELALTKDSISLQIGKSSRDATGSYYTPKDLACATAQKALNSICSSTDYSGFRIADLSCGCGEFFEACYSILSEDKKLTPETIVTMFRGVDVDPIALQICICRLIKKVQLSEWESIISNFRLGNPLIHSNNEIGFMEKTNLFALGRLYAPQMGIDLVEDKEFSSIDLVIGNPPWEKIRFEERRFFAHICPEIAKITKKDNRQNAINKLKKTWPDLYYWCRDVQNDYSLMTAKTYRHPLIQLSACGELNTYALFTELASNLLSEEGISSLILKSSIVTSPVNKPLFSSYLNKGQIRNISLFENKAKIFNIDSRERFCVLTTSKKANPSFSFSAGLTTVDEYLANDFITVEPQEIKLINPSTGMIPNVSDTRHISFLIHAHRRLPVFDSVFPDCHFGRLIHLTAHAKYIGRTESSENLPIYEGKFLEQYNARFSTFEGMSEDKKYSAKASAIKNYASNDCPPFPQSRFFVQKSLWNKYLQQYPSKYSLCWRSLTSPTNYRTMIAMILKTQPTCQSVQMLQTKDYQELVLLLGLFNSKPFDYFVRLKMPGIDLTQSVIRQIPVPSPEDFDSVLEYRGNHSTIKKHVLSYVAYLLSKEPTLEDLIAEIKANVYPVPDNISFCAARQYIDELFINAYGFSKSEGADILNSFSS